MVDKPMTPSSPEAIALLRAWSAGDQAALAQLVLLVEAEFALVSLARYAHLIGRCEIVLRTLASR
jgi:hypothetical protein